MYYAVSQMGSQNSDIGVATSPSMEQGTWTDYGSLGLPDSPTRSYNKIDANLLQPSPSPTGAPPTFLIPSASTWPDASHTPRATPPRAVATAAPADAAAASSPSPALNVAAAAPTPVNLEYNGTNTGPAAQKASLAPSEGSYQFWWKVDGKTYYYLFFSSGACCDFDPSQLPPAGEEYKVMVCRSEKPDRDFVDRDGKECMEAGGTIVLGSSGNMYAPGGQGVLFNKDMNSPVMYYHYSKLRHLIPTMRRCSG